MTRRIVRLLDPPELTPRQLAQKKYRASAKGREATRRSIAKQRAKEREDAREKALKRARAIRWRQANPVQVRVYMRTYMRRWRIERQQQQPDA